ncbi:MAG: M1 family aminopeptidase [Chthoniobacterales bacterium]
MRFTILFSIFLFTSLSLALPPDATKPLLTDKFRPLEEILPTPNSQRTASGAPGHSYWQQQADHEINVELDDVNQKIIGSEKITYHNNSPDSLSYLWLQLDPNFFAKDSHHRLTDTLRSATPTGFNLDKFHYKDLEGRLLEEKFDGGVTITSLTDADGKTLPHTTVKTMMRVDLPKPLAPGATYILNVAWHYTINDGTLLTERTGYEFFKKDKNYIYEIGNWYPRMCSYTDVNGWQSKQYLGDGEFALEFGNYLVNITVPDDHVVAASGLLQNPEQVLTATQRQRLKEAATATMPHFIITPDEAKKNESHQPTGKKTWTFKADNIRTFAFACSRKFIWDAQAAPAHASQNPAEPVMAMSFYPKEAEPLWSKFSTEAIIAALDVYSEHTIPFPYPTAISVNGPIYGMEYSMISFSGGRPEEDGTYSKSEKNDLLSTIIHEVGHNYFPMILNSDERRWGWLDEGLNTFLQYLTEQRWEKDFPSQRGEPRDVVPYMKSSPQVPIMTAPDSVIKLGGNAYSKPSAALNILRETILGRDLFDFAFKTYAQRWAFKRPEPADFFRTMQDASGVDLSWFWRGWFYTIDPCDIAIDNVHEYTLDSYNPAIEKAAAKKEHDELPETLSHQRNATEPKRVDTHPELKDFYSTFDDSTLLPSDREKFEKLLKELEGAKIDPKILQTKRNFYVIDFSNRGGLVMPIILKIDYTDGSSEEMRIPAEIWRFNNESVSKFLITTKEIKSLELDPHEETADIDRNNNYWPRRPIKEKLKLFQEEKKKNPMQELAKPSGK